MTEGYDRVVRKIKQYDTIVLIYNRDRERFVGIEFENGGKEWFQELTTIAGPLGFGLREIERILNTRLIDMTREITIEVIGD